MKTKYLILLVGCALFSCSSNKEWVFESNITLDESVRPLGIARVDNGFWISDPDNNKILNIDLNGVIIKKTEEVFRPMHIDFDGEKLFIANFYNDAISFFQDGTVTTMEMDIAFDAPASVSVDGEIMAFADFYNHRIMLSNKGVITQISEEGRTDGLLYYPTDVKLYKNKVVVADAYNNRVQIFDLQGNFLKVIGWNENIRVATGVDVFEDKIYIDTNR